VLAPRLVKFGVQVNFWRRRTLRG